MILRHKSLLSFFEGVDRCNRQQQERPLVMTFYLMIWVFIVPIALLLIGLADLPTGYYTLVRIVVSLVSVFASYLSYKSDEKVGIATVAFALLALLFNPVFPIYLQDKEVWTVIDIIAAAFLGIRYFTLDKSRGC